MSSQPSNKDGSCSRQLSMLSCNPISSDFDGKSTSSLAKGLKSQEDIPSGDLKMPSKTSGQTEEKAKSLKLNKVTPCKEHKNKVHRGQRCVVSSRLQFKSLKRVANKSLVPMSEWAKVYKSVGIQVDAKSHDHEWVGCKRALDRDDDIEA